MNGLEAIQKAKENGVRFKSCYSNQWEHTDECTSSFFPSSLLKEGWEVETPLKVRWLCVCTDGECFFKEPLDHGASAENGDERCSDDIISTLTRMVEDRD